MTKRENEIEKQANYICKSSGFLTHEDLVSMAEWADENPSYPPMKKLYQKIGLLRQQLAIAKEELEKIKFYAECSDIPWFVKLTKEALAQISEVGR